MENKSFGESGMRTAGRMKMRPVFVGKYILRNKNDLQRPQWRTMLFEPGA